MVAREIAEMKSSATSRIYTVLLTGSATISKSPIVLPKPDGTSSGRLNTFKALTIIFIFGSLRRALIGCDFATNVF